MTRNQKRLAKRKAAKAKKKAAAETVGGQAVMFSNGGAGNSQHGTEALERATGKPVPLLVKTKRSLDRKRRARKAEEESARQGRGRPGKTTGD